MAYYVRSLGPAGNDQFWRIDDDEAVLLGIHNPQHGHGTYFAKGEHGSAWEALRRGTPWFDGDTPPFQRLELAPRHFYPRIARPISSSRQEYMRSPSAEIEGTTVALGVGQVTTLMRRLDVICQTVHPDPSTFGVFGHEIRNLLILAATEVEANWRGVLVANGTTGDRLTTAEYVRLLRPMRLDAYAVGFTSFPWLAPMKPFAGWTRDRPSRSLSWYEAYNSTKHDREGAFHQANLLHALHAVCACVIMLVAQFTHSIGLGGEWELSRYFRLTEVPRWTADELYCDLSEDGAGWRAVPHGDLNVDR